MIPSPLFRRALSVGAFIVPAVLLSLSALMCDPNPTPRTPPLGPAPEGWTDCITVLRISRWRGHQVANVHRFGGDHPTLRTASRVADLQPDDLSAFCDWESCLHTNGYAHSCWVNDAGLEQCRVCDAGDSCDGLPLDRAACVAGAMEPRRASCHVGLSQDCLIQRAIRGFADMRVTETCRLSAQACAGELPGDLSAQATAGQHETDQVAIEHCIRELELATQLDPSPVNPAPQQHWRGLLSQWEGGLPADSVVDAATLFSDAGLFDE